MTFGHCIASLKEEFLVGEREAFRTALWAFCSIGETIPDVWLPIKCKHAEIEVSGVKLGMSAGQVIDVLGEPRIRTPRCRDQQARAFEFENGIRVRFSGGHLVWSNGSRLLFNGVEVLKVGASKKTIPSHLGPSEERNLYYGRRLHFQNYYLHVSVNEEGCVTNMNQGFGLLSLAREQRIGKSKLSALIESELHHIRDPLVVEEIRTHLVDPILELRNWDYDQRKEPKADHEYWIVANTADSCFAIAYTRDAFGGGTIPFPWGRVETGPHGYDQDSLWSETLEDVWRRWGSELKSRWS